MNKLTKSVMLVVFMHFILLIPFVSLSQSHEWASTITATTFSSVILTDQEIDTDGNLISCGIFYGSPDFDPGTAVDNQNSFNAINWDIFIQKLDQNGNLIWYATYGLGEILNYPTLAVDDANNIFVGGVFQDSVDFDPGPGVDGITSPQISYFLHKLNSSGIHQWVKTFDADHFSTFPKFTDIEVGSNAIYLVGNCLKTTDFDPGPGVNNVQSANNGAQNSAFILELTTAGEFSNIKTYSDSYSVDIFTPSFPVNIHGLYLDNDENVYVVGFYRGTVDFDHGPGTALHTSPTLESEPFVLKINASDDFEWVNVYPNSSAPYPTDINGNEFGDVYIVGSFTGTIDMDPNQSSGDLTSAGSEDAFIQKMDANGAIEWSKAYGGTADDNANSVTCNTPGLVYLTGKFEGTADFNPDNAVVIQTSQGGSDVYFLSLDDQGNYVSSVSVGGQYPDEGKVINSSSLGDIYISGSCSDDTIDFDPGPAVDEEIVLFGSAFNWALKEDNVGLVSIPNDHNVKVYPNPTWNKSVMIYSANNAFSSYQILTVHGKIVQSGKLIQGEEIYLDCPNGIYLLKLSGKNGQLIKRINVL